MSKHFLLRISKSKQLVIWVSFKKNSYHLDWFLGDIRTPLVSIGECYHTDCFCEDEIGDHKECYHTGCSEDFKL